MAEGLEALLRSAQAALSAASATLPSAEERRAEAAAAESLAVSGAVGRFRIAFLSPVAPQTQTTPYPALTSWQFTYGRRLLRSFIYYRISH